MGPQFCHQLDPNSYLSHSSDPIHHFMQRKHLLIYLIIVHITNPLILRRGPLLLHGATGHFYKELSYPSTESYLVSLPFTTERKAPLHTQPLFQLTAYTILLTILVSHSISHQLDAWFTIASSWWFQQSQAQPVISYLRQHLPSKQYLNSTILFFLDPQMFSVEFSYLLSLCPYFLPNSQNPDICI